VVIDGIQAMKVEQRLRGSDVVEFGEPFDNAWRVQATDPEFAREFVDANLQRWLLTLDTRWRFEVSGPWVLAFQGGRHAPGRRAGPPRHGVGPRRPHHPEHGIRPVRGRAGERRGPERLGRSPLHAQPPVRVRREGHGNDQPGAGDEVKGYLQVQTPAGADPVAFLLTTDSGYGRQTGRWTLGSEPSG